MARLADTLRWRDFSGGNVTNVSSDIVVQNSVPFSMNLIFDKELGLALTREGTSIVGAQLSAGNPCLGLYQHIDSTVANSKLFAGFGTSIYDVIGGDAEVTGLTASSKQYYCTFLNATLMLNGAEKRSYTHAGGWISTGGAFDLGNIPSGAKFPIEWKDRVYCAVTDRLYYTTVASAGSVSWTNSGSGSIQVEQEDGGGTITGLAKVPGYLLVFKERSLKRWNFDSTFPEDLVNIGTQSQASIVYGQGTVFFFYGGKGFYATKGNYPVRISKPIQRIIDAIPASYYDDVSGWCDNEYAYWSIGDITVDFGYGYTETHNNVVVRYSLETQEWSIWKYAHEFRFMAKYLVSSQLQTIGGDTDGQVIQINSGNSDYSGQAINWILQTPEFDYGRRELLKTVSEKIIVHSHNAGGALLQARTNYGQWTVVGAVTGLVSEIQLKKPLTGNVFEYRLINATTGEQSRIRGLDFPNIDVLANTD